MHFVVVSPQGDRMMGTHDEECIPYNYIASAEIAGYKFLLDEKFITAKQIFKRKVEMDKAAGIKSTTVVSTSAKPIGVRCINNGIVYKTQSEAAKALGIDPAAVSDSIKLGRPRSGYSFEKVFE